MQAVLLFPSVKIIPDPSYCIIYNCFFSHLCSTTCCLCLLSPALSLPFHLNQTQSDVSSHHHPHKIAIGRTISDFHVTKSKGQFCVLILVEWSAASVTIAPLFGTLSFFDSQEITLLLFLLHTFNFFSPFFLPLPPLTISECWRSQDSVLGPLALCVFPWLHQVLRFQIPPLCQWIPTLFLQPGPLSFTQGKCPPLPT